MNGNRGFPGRSNPPGDDATNFGGSQPADPWGDDWGAAGAKSLAPGMLLSHTYQVEALLARGGMGEVYRARHVELGTQHAIKIILPELANQPHIAEMFRREAGALSRLHSDAVVGYGGLMKDDRGRLFLVMEYVEGPSLKQVLGERRLSVADCFKLRDRLAEGLAAAHDLGVVHRDISPDNVILEGGRLEGAKLIDFGIAKLGDPSKATVVGDNFAGKYAFASPEQMGLGGAVDARSDIYSLGLLLAAAALGKPLDMGRSPKDIIDLRRRVPDLSAIPEPLRPSLRAMLQPDPEDRPQSLRDLLRAFPGPAARDGGEAMRTTSPRTAAARMASRPEPAGSGRGVLLLSILVVLLSVVAFGAGWWFFIRSPDAACPFPWGCPDVIAGNGGDAGDEPPPRPDRPEEPTDPDVVTEPDGPPVDPVDLVETGGAAGQVALLPPEDLLARAQAVLAGVAGGCGQLSAALGPAQEVVVSGFLPSEAEAQRLRTALAGQPDLAAARLDVAVHPGIEGAVCDIVGLLGRRTAAGPAAGAPAIGTDSGATNFIEGEKVQLRIQAGGQGGFLYVAQVDPVGTVDPLFPSALVPESLASNGAVAPGAQVVLPPGDVRFTVRPPLGPNTILAVSTPTPLFDAPRETEPAPAFLAALDQALARQPAGAARSDVLVMTLLPR